MNWHTAHRAKIAQARELTEVGDPIAAFAALDEAEAIRVGEMQRMKASQDAADLLHPQKVRAALEALDFSRPAQAEIGCELLWVINYVGALRVYQATLEEEYHVQ